MAEPDIVVQYRCVVFSLSHVVLPQGWSALKPLLDIGLRASLGGPHLYPLVLSVSLGVALVEGLERVVHVGLGVQYPKCPLCDPG